MTVSTRRRLVGLMVLVGMGLAVVASSVRAEVPSHVPGTLCFTKWFWCYAQPPGPPGTNCACPSPQGPIPGVRG